MQRYRLQSDDEGHSYVIPVEKDDEFAQWIKFIYSEDYDTKKWQGTDFDAMQIDGLDTLTFTDPQEG